MVNCRGRSYFPEGGYSATLAEPNIRKKVFTETDLKMSNRRNHKTTTTMEWSVINYWGQL